MIWLGSSLWEFPWSLPYHWPSDTQPWQLHPICSLMPTKMLSIALETEYSFPQADKVKEYLADPSKFAAVIAPTAAADSGAAPAAAVEEEKKEEPANESDDDLGFSLFD